MNSGECKEHFSTSHKGRHGERAQPEADVGLQPMLRLWLTFLKAFSCIPIVVFCHAVDSTYSILPESDI